MGKVFGVHSVSRLFWKKSPNRFFSFCCVASWLSGGNATPQRNCLRQEKKFPLSLLMNRFGVTESLQWVPETVDHFVLDAICRIAQNEVATSFGGILSLTDNVFVQAKRASKLKKCSATEYWTICCAHANTMDVSNQAARFVLQNYVQVCAHHARTATPELKSQVPDSDTTRSTWSLSLLIHATIRIYSLTTTQDQGMTEWSTKWRATGHNKGQASSIQKIVISPWRWNTCNSFDEALGLCTNWICPLPFSFEEEHWIMGSNQLKKQQHRRRVVPVCSFLFFSWTTV